jgi:hypothetical protein
MCLLHHFTESHLYIKWKSFILTLFLRSPTLLTVQLCVRQLLDHTTLVCSAMPSLRRTLSSPSVRSSPYPASLSNATNGLPAGRSQGHGQRRSSGTEISGRRVLADIEWWRVADGQRDVDTTPEPEEHDHDRAQEQGQVVEELSGILGSDPGVERFERPLTPFAGTSHNAVRSLYPLRMEQLADFASH